MEKTLIAIGGGEIKNKTTLQIDKYVNEIVRDKLNGVRPTALFLGTASHDSMPYFNSFRKTYTSILDIKAEVALIVYGEMDFEHVKQKFDKADIVYIGGGDTLFMLEKWKETGIYDLVLNAYESGKIIVGLSAGAICWFNDMYTDYEIMRNVSADYVLKKGMNVIDGTFCPHYNERREDFIKAFKNSSLDCAYCVENDCAIQFVNGRFSKVISSGGKAFTVSKKGEDIVECELK